MNYSLTLAVIGAASLAFAAVPDGAVVYQTRCAVCHDNAKDRVPTKDALAQRTPEDILAALTTGPMKAQGSAMPAEEKNAVSTFLAGKAFGAGTEPQGIENRCPGAPHEISLGENQWNGWGRDLDNSRFQPAPGLKAEDVPRLKVKWAFGYPAPITYGQPTIIGDRIFVSTVTGKIYSLDAKTGCTHWSIEVGAPVRTAISVGALPIGWPARYAAYFGDDKANAYAVDAATGKVLWKIQLDQHPLARVTGSPTLHQGRLYVPLSSWEEGAGRIPGYECCKFQGAVVALDAYTGKRLWRTSTIPDPPKPFKKAADGTQMYGPAGASVWMAPTIDVKRKAIYIGTGNSYTDIDVNSANAIVALDLETGRTLWVKQMTSKDNYLVGCYVPGQGTCPTAVGPDVDFGSSPILRKMPNGKDVILAGQKSGVMWAIDPDQRGKVLWTVQLGQGSPLGGIEWGPAADRDQVYVAISDVLPKKGFEPGGISALKIGTGEKVWQTPAPKVRCSWGPGVCSPAQSAAVTAIPGVVFSGALDGHLRAYSSKDGAIVWDFDTAAKPYETVNGLTASGGSIDHAGATIANGILFLNSGYARITGQRGNVLIAFTVDGK
jgi:polyvinyl alcohol dehydrogenase (cytochrome)